jgi:hypothetical protein
MIRFGRERLQTRLTTLASSIGAISVYLWSPFAFDNNSRQVAVMMLPTEVETAT